MDRLRFRPDSADAATTLYRRLAADRQPEADHTASAAHWNAIGAALDRALALAAAGGVAPATLEALDVALVGVVRAAADGQRAAFDAGLRSGAALAGLQEPSLN
jgi:hypothetical protein